jgi:hypothetical protein
MRRGVCFGILLLSLLLPVNLSAVASAQEFNHTITAYAVVPEQRAVYLDPSGNIIKIAGNTAKNIPPQVYDSTNHLINITDSITQQYQRFLKSHGNHLAAGQIYAVNPIIVDTTANNQTIGIGASYRALTLTLK